MHNGAMELHPAHHPKEIGRRIIMLRQLMGATNAAAFARSIGITPQALNNYERGVGRPEFLVALKLVQRCGVTLDWLYRGETSGLSAVMLNQIATHEQAESAPAPAAPAPSGTL